MNTSKTELTAVTEREGRTAGFWTSGLRMRFVECHCRKQNGPSHNLPADNTGQFLHSKCIARQFHLTMLYRLRRLHTLPAMSNSQTAGLSQWQSAFACKFSRTAPNRTLILPVPLPITTEQRSVHVRCRISIHFTSVLYFCTHFSSLSVPCTCILSLSGYKVCAHLATLLQLSC